MDQDVLVIPIKNGGYSIAMFSLPEGTPLKLNMEPQNLWRFFRDDDVDVFFFSPFPSPDIFRF